MKNPHDTLRGMRAGHLDDYLKKEKELSYKELVEYVRSLGFADPPELYYRKMAREHLMDGLTPEECELLKNGNSVMKKETLPSGQVISGLISPLGNK